MLAIVLEMVMEDKPCIITCQTTVQIRIHHTGRELNGQIFPFTYFFDYFEFYAVTSVSRAASLLCTYILVQR